MMKTFQASLSATAAQARPIAFAAGGAALAGLVGVALLRDPLLALDLAKPFEMLHGLLSSAIVAGLALVALTVVAAPLAQLASGLAALQKLLMGAAVAGALPLATPADPGEAKAGETQGVEKAAAATEFQVGVYGGWNETMPSLVRYRQPKGTDLTIKDIQWLGESFEIEPYWGVRGTVWPARLKRLGVMFDYAHAKASALKTQTLNQSGTRDGQPVPATEPFSKTFRKLEFTHGLNFFTLNAVYRITGLHARFVPYLGLGLGISMPHVDTQRAGWEKDTRTYVHQITGPTVQFLGGLEWRFHGSGRGSAFAEYKLNHSRNAARLKGGGSLETNLWTHQVPVGLSFHYRRMPK
ncbi:MAG: outer membrane protein [Methyloligellaceae bacterium]